MIRRIFTGSFWLTGVACATVAIATAAQAGHVRYISTTGSNANPCTLAKPCKTLQRGINRTPVRGELRILASGDYGSNGNIGKSITISGNGNTVTIINPITVNKASATVVLRGLALNGRASADHGIRIIAARTVHVERCVVYGFPGRGIRDQSAGNLFILDSIFRNNGNQGLSIFASGAVTVTVDNSRFENNQGGMQIGSNGGSIDVAINRTVVAGNTGDGIEVTSGARVIITRTVAAHNSGAGYATSTGSQLTIESSAAHNNTNGLVANANTNTRISASVFVNNVTGINNNGGTVLTRGNNTASGNTNADTVGTLIALPGV